MRSWWFAIALCACGDVNKIPDAAIPDTYTPDSPTELTCATGEMQCSGTCANLMTSDLHCGSCNTQCSPTQGCLNGSCVDKASRCSSIRLWDPQAPDGVYFNPNTGSAMYCDFTNGITYDDFRFYRFDSAPSGYTLARANDFTNAGFAKAFIAYFNHYKGLRAYGSWSYSNCCVTTVAGSRLTVGGSPIFVGTGATSPGCVFSMTTDVAYRMNRSGNALLDTLPDDFFTVNAPSEAANCSDGTNPAIWYKRRFTLN